MSFIPSLHFRPAAEKLTPDFCNEVINFYYRNRALVPLLEHKDVDEIEDYATGNFSMKPFKRMFGSLRKQEGKMNNPNVSEVDKQRWDKTNIHWEPVALIVAKLNSAIAAIQNRSLDISATCLDPLAQRKKTKDLDFLRNKVKMEEAMQPLYDSMNLGKADLGSTEHSAVPFTGLPLDLDVEDEEEFNFFANMIYNLAPEFAIETLMEILKEIKNFQQLYFLETTDQLKFGVSCHQTIHDKISSLPNSMYWHPKYVRTDRSFLPDHADNLFRCIDMIITPMELFNFVPNEINGLKELERIVNGDGSDSLNKKNNTGYCACNGKDNQGVSTFDTFKMNLKFCEVKSVDYVMVSQRKNSRFKIITEDEKKPHEKLWAQNTYCFYWLENTKHFFGIDRLPFAHREPGQEIYSGFSTNIYRSQRKSAVELCVGENKKAQTADIKLQHEIINALPDGYQVNMKGLRKAVNSMLNLSEDQKKEMITELLETGKEKNIWVFESDEFDARPGSQNNQPPITAIAGGLKSSIEGYYRVIAECNRKISQYTGINDALTGQDTNPDALIGLQKLNTQASINAIDYVPKALLSQYKKMFNIWFNYIQTIIKNGGAGKEALVKMVGTRQVDILKGLNEVPLHQMGIKISLGPTEEQKNDFKQQVYLKSQQGVLDSFDLWILDNIPNSKEAAFALGVKEKRWQKKQDQKQKDMLAAQQQIAQQQGQNMLQNTQAQTDGKIQTIQATGDVDAKLMQLGAQLGLSQSQMDYIAKLKLQQARGNDQLSKSLQTLGAKNSLENQKSFAQ